MGKIWDEFEDQCRIHNAKAAWVEEVTKVDELTPEEEAEWQEKKDRRSRSAIQFWKGVSIGALLALLLVFGGFLFYWFTV